MGKYSYPCKSKNTSSAHPGWRAYASLMPSISKLRHASRIANNRTAAIHPYPPLLIPARTRIIQPDWLHVQSDISVFRRQATFQKPEANPIGGYRWDSANTFITHRFALGDLTPMSILIHVNRKTGDALSVIANLLPKDKTIVLLRCCVKRYRE